MIVDFSTSTETQWTADICIVGSGVIGLAMVKELMTSGKRLIVLEKGGHEHSKQLEATQDCEITGHAFTGHRDGRVLGFGGTARAWGGQALPLDATEMRSRQWVNLEGWPIDPAELEQYYESIDEFLSVDKVSYDADLDALRKLKKTEFDQTLIRYHFSKWSRKPDISIAMRTQLMHASNVIVIENGTVCNLHMNEAHNRIEQVQIKNVNHRVATIHARQFVLCMGGLENARLLLLSNTQSPQGIGNTHGNVGAFFQDHPTAQVGTVTSDDEFQLQRKFNYFFYGKTRMLPRLSLAHSAQRKHGVLAATAFVQFIPKETALFSDLREMERLVRRGKLPSSKLLASPLVKFNQWTSLGRSAGEYLFRKRLYTPDSTPRLTVMIEQTPSAESRVGLSNELDHQGLPKARIHWAISELTAKTLLVLCNVLDREFKRLKLGRIEWDAWTQKSEAAILENLCDAFHHMGTTRMSEDPKDGVVDAQCRVHGLQNLYIAGTSVFVTSGHSNPTYTAIALAMRCANHLAKAS